MYSSSDSDNNEIPYWLSSVQSFSKTVVLLKAKFCTAQWQPLFQSSQEFKSIQFSESQKHNNNNNNEGTNKKKLKSKLNNQLLAMEKRQQQLLQQQEAKQNLKTQIQNSPKSSENKQSSRSQNKSQCSTSQSKNHTKIAKHYKNAYSNASSSSSSSHKRKNAHSKTCNCKKCKRQPKKSSFRIRKKNTVSFIKTLQNAKKTTRPTPPKKNSFNLRKTRLYLRSPHANAKYKNTTQKGLQVQKETVTC